MRPLARDGTRKAHTSVLPVFLDSFDAIGATKSAVAQSKFRLSKK
jgi:hypothetical protein